MLEQHGMVGSFGPVVHGVVPVWRRDRHARVIPLAGMESTGLPPLTLNTDVVGNVFAVSVPRANGGHFPTDDGAWRSALKER